MMSSLFADSRQRPAAAPFLPRPGCHVLASGLEVWVMEDAAVPLVALAWCSPWGAALDPPGHEGLAALAAQLLRGGTVRRPAGALDEALEALGADLFARCDWDGSSVTLEVLSEDLDPGLATLCEVAQTPRFPAEVIERWRRWQATELAKRRRQPFAVAEDTLAQALYGPARYGLPLIGTEDGIRRLARSHVEAVHGCGSDPRRARLIAVGCVDEGALLRRLEDLVDGEVASANPPPALGLPAAPLHGRRVLLVDAPQAPRTELRLGWIGVRRTDGDFARLTLLSAILGGPFWSRLGCALRQDRGYVYSVYSRLEERRGPAPFVIGATTGHGDAGAVVREILHELERLRSEPVPAGELEAVQEQLGGSRAAELQTCHSRARRFRRMAVHGLSETDIARERKEVRSLSPEDLAALARRFFDLSSITIVAVGPSVRLRAQLAPFGEVSVLGEPRTRM